jgi:hypothetical protein
VTVDVGVDVVRCTDIAAVRENGKAGFASHRPLSHNYELLGVMGEAAFSAVFGLPVDESRRPGGDAGVDFRVSFTIDVKTARRAANLIVEVGRVHADIYVLAEAHPEMSNGVRLVGWAWGKDVLSAPVDDGARFRNGIRNHWIAARDLRPVGSLRALMDRRFP